MEGRGGEMIAEIGQFALILALVVALAQSVVPMVGAARDDAGMMALATSSAGALVLLLGFAFAALTHAFVVSDFSLTVVASNSHSAKPMLYKVAGVWGNHEGSMLLWVLILAVFGAAVAWFGGNLPPALKARALAVQGMIASAFLAFIVFTSNPFDRLSPAPPDGAGLNPLLQDPGLAFHPPLLYLGYVGFSMAFSFAVAALIEGRVDAAWARWVRPWTLAAWTFLTAGIALGSWWAYYELGWGGWWYWDPVENSSFMPWLFGTALLHSAIVVEKRDALKSWTILLAILTFSMSLLGTFLVRSGVLTSVHAFATDPERGIFILLILAIAIGGALLLFAIRAPSMKGGGIFAPVSREGALVLNNMLRALAGKLVPAAMAAVAAIALTFALVPDTAALAPFGMGLAAWLAAGALAEFASRIRLFSAAGDESWRRLKGLPRSAAGMTLAHLGLAVMIAGITGSSAWRLELIGTLGVGDSLSGSGYSVTLDDINEGVGPNYRFQQGILTVRRDGAAVTTLKPERRFFPVANQATTEAGIVTNWLADLYGVIGEPAAEPGTRTAQQAWTVRFYVNPLVPWIWGGALLMVAGGGLSLSDRRHRVGAPRRAASAPAGGAPAAAE
jgi:cytochrome c-type biogenesis protein CcmF